MKTKRILLMMCFLILSSGCVKDKANFPLDKAKITEPPKLNDKIEFPNYTLQSGSQKYPESLLGNYSNFLSDILLLDNTRVLLIEGNQIKGYKISTLDLAEDKILWNKNYNDVLDIDVGNKQIMLLLPEKDFIKKVILDFKGNLLSENYLTDIKTKQFSTNTQQQYEWIKATKNDSEQIIFLDDDTFYFYKHPWKKPYKTFKVNLEQLRKEYRQRYNGNVYISNWSYVNGTFVLGLVGGKEMHLADTIIKLVNRKNKSLEIINEATEFEISDNTVLLNSIKPEKKYFSYYETNLEDNKITLKETHLDIKLDSSKGYHTEITDKYIYVRSISDGSWNLYTLDGNLMLKNIKGFQDIRTVATWEGDIYLSDTKFIKFIDNKAYFLVLNPNEKTVSLKTFVFK